MVREHSELEILYRIREYVAAITHHPVAGENPAALSPSPKIGPRITRGLPAY
jgi:hypothetical protein